MPEEKREPEKEPQPLIMIITMQLNGEMQVSFPMLANQIVSYGFLKMAEKTLDNFYTEQTKSRITKPNGIMNFVRGMKH